jgi:membrane protease YdiL (CAAX protease family)
MRAPDRVIPRTGPVLIGFVILWATMYQLGHGTRTGIEHGLVAAAVVLVVAVVIQRYLLRGSRERGVAQLCVSLGLGRPEVRAILAAVAASFAVVSALTTYVTLSGVDVQLRAHWPWLVVCLLAYHGFAEELIWRGYAFGHLRRDRTFGRAVLASTPLLAATHMPIILESGVVIGIVAMLLAALTCLPLSHLYEISGGTIWPGALLHACIDSFKLVDVPAGATGFSMAVAGVCALVPLLVLAWRRDLRDAHTRGDRHTLTQPS